jgi:hypothetical protein
VNFASQPDMVRASLLVDEQRQHRHDAPARLALVRGTNAQPTPVSVESHPRVHASSPTEAGCDGRGSTPTPPVVCRECGTRWGYTHTDRYLDGGSSWRGDICPVCDWDTAPAVRIIPGTRRAA